MDDLDTHALDLLEPGQDEAEAPSDRLRKPKGRSRSLSRSGSSLAGSSLLAWRKPRFGLPCEAHPCEDIKEENSEGLEEEAQAGAGMKAAGRTGGFSWVQREAANADGLEDRDKERTMIPKQFDQTRIESFIKDLGEEELRYLNGPIVERLKLIWQEKSTRSMSRFNLGELVRFSDNDGRMKTGRIVRLNKKTASILTSDGQHWKVSPGLLQSAEGG